MVQVSARRVAGCETKDRARSQLSPRSNPGSRRPSELELLDAHVAALLLVDVPAREGGGHQLECWSGSQLRARGRERASRRTSRRRCPGCRAAQSWASGPRPRPPCPPPRRPACRPCPRLLARRHPLLPSRPPCSAPAHPRLLHLLHPRQQLQRELVQASTAARRRRSPSPG